jgi:hypothetical protein
MSGILGGKTFTKKHMAKMSVAIGANDFYSATIGIGYPFDSARDFFIKTGPSTLSVKFVVGSIEGCIALLACVGASFIVMLILAAKGSLGSLVKDDALFFRCQFVVFHSLLRLVAVKENQGKDKDGKRIRKSLYAGSDHVGFLLLSSFAANISLLLNDR